MMLDFIKGKIIELTPTSVVIETGNLGYLLSISLNTYSCLYKKENCKLYTYEIFRENIYQFFGFIEKKERQLFVLLISVSGVGVNTARMILSALTTHELEEVIISGNLSALKMIKGIGNKTAERIMIDLKDKIKTIDHSDNNLIMNSTYLHISKEAVSALVMLGFNRSISQKSVDKVIQEHPTQTIEQIIKKALKIL